MKYSLDYFETLDEESLHALQNLLELPVSPLQVFEEANQLYVLTKKDKLKRLRLEIYKKLAKHGALTHQFVALLCNPKFRHLYLLKEKSLAEEAVKKLDYTYEQLRKKTYYEVCCELANHEEESEEIVNNFWDGLDELAESVSASEVFPIVVAEPVSTSEVPPEIVAESVSASEVPPEIVAESVSASEVPPEIIAEPEIIEDAEIVETVADTVRTVESVAEDTLEILEETEIMTVKDVPEVAASPLETLSEIVVLEATKDIPETFTQVIEPEVTESASETPGEDTLEAMESIQETSEPESILDALAQICPEFSETDEALKPSLIESKMSTPYEFLAQSPEACLKVLHRILNFRALGMRTPTPKKWENNCLQFEPYTLHALSDDLALKDQMLRFCAVLEHLKLQITSVCSEDFGVDDQGNLWVTGGWENYTDVTPMLEQNRFLLLGLLPAQRSIISSLDSDALVDDCESDEEIFDVTTSSDPDTDTDSCEIFEC